MPMTIKLKIASIEGLILEEEVDQITIPTQMGEITVLPNHIPLIAALSYGELLAKKGDVDIPFAVYGGFVEIAKNEVRILTDVARYAPEIELEKVQDARKKADELLGQKGEYSKEYQELITSFETQIGQAKVAEKFRTKKYRKLPNWEEMRGRK